MALAVFMAGQADVDHWLVCCVASWASFSVVQAVEAQALAWWCWRIFHNYGSRLNAIGFDSYEVSAVCFLGQTLVRATLKLQCH